MFTALMLHRYCPPGGTRHFVVANGGNLFWQGGESYPGGQQHGSTGTRIRDCISLETRKK